VLFAVRARWFVRGDVDGFFGLFVDNLLQLMLVFVLAPTVCGLPEALVLGRILPGAAISILLGNLFYAYQAHETGRPDATALPFGINTPSLLAYVFLVMGPVYQETGDPVLAWRVGLFAGLASGVLEGLGAFAGDWLRRYTPRAALLSALAGVALTFISMGFVFQIFARPWIALLPALFLLATYASRVRLPFGLPGGVAAVVLGTGVAWVLRVFDPSLFEPSRQAVGLAFRPPVPAVGDALALFSDARAYRYMSVVVPLALFNVVGSLQNLESAEAAGDRYASRPSLLANAIATIVAALFGCPFPTTIYIGHPAWKAMGARRGYSILNGVVISALCLVGGLPLVLRVVPLEVTLGILLWVGLIITAQAFQEVPREHAIAVVLGLIPSLAAWALVLVETTLRAAGTRLFDVAPKFGAELYVRGIMALSQGFILTSMMLAAIMVFVVERRFLRAAAWALAASVLSTVGLIHAYDLTPAGVENHLGFGAAPGFGLMYALTAATLVGLHFSRARGRPRQAQHGSGDELPRAPSDGAVSDPAGSPAAN
jgi:adenine/guanine/hypoxanthine permease